MITFIYNFSTEQLISDGKFKKSDCLGGQRWGRDWLGKGTGTSGRW